jgi:hypothetical protein
LPSTVNPYPPSTKEHDDWSFGYWEADNALPSIVETIMSKPKRHGVTVSFNPRPNSISVPCPITVANVERGELTSYDHEKGSGYAMLDGDLTMPEIVCLQVGGFHYLRLDLVAKPKL